MNCCNGEENESSTMCNPCPYDLNCDEYEIDKTIENLQKVKEHVRSKTNATSMRKLRMMNYIDDAILAFTRNAELHKKTVEGNSASIDRLNKIIKEQEQVIEKYKTADTFLASHGWKW